MFRPPLKEHVNPNSDFEQTVQAYEQGYEHRRQGKLYSNPWKRTEPEYDAYGMSRTKEFGWEDELNMWYYNGYYDWNPGDWVPYIAEEQQNDYAIDPKTNKSRKTLPRGATWPKEAWNMPAPVVTNTVTTAIIDLNAVVAENPLIA